MLNRINGRIKKDADMKSNNFSGITENEPGSVVEDHGDEQKDILVDVLAKPLRSIRRAIDTNLREIKSSGQIEGVIIGKVVTCDASGAVTVDYPDNPNDCPLLAASVVVISEDDINKDVALMFEAGNPQRPVIMGQLQHSPVQVENNQPEAVNVQLDGKRLTFTAEQEIVLRCGEASITLTRAGKVIIRGEYLLSRSTGTNRIKGGSVQIN